MLYHSVKSKCSTKISDSPFPQLENLLSCSLSLSSFYADACLEVREMFIEDDVVHLFVRCCNNHGICPYCGVFSSKIHNMYYRTIVDLSILGKVTTVHMESRKSFCSNEKCKKKTFAEQTGNEVFRYRRRIRRYEVFVAKQG